jgi:putative membrane protein
VSTPTEGGEPRRPKWLREGSDPDYRFTLANERTFLAWIRTALALLAAAVALVQFVPSFRLPGARTALGLIVALDGLVISVLAYRRWAGIERAMRHGQTLPHSPMLAVLAVSLAAVGIIVLAVVLASPA